MKKKTENISTPFFFLPSRFQTYDLLFFPPRRIYISFFFATFRIIKNAIKAYVYLSSRQDFADLLSSDLEMLKRKFVIETKFKSKQEAYRDKLQGELDTVRSKLSAEREALSELESHKESLQQVLLETTGKVEADLSVVRVQLDTENKLVAKMQQYTASLAQQLEFVKGSLVAAGDVREHLEVDCTELSCMMDIEGLRV